MTAYRFCRTDDMARLVEAHNHCWLPHHPDEPPLTLPQFKGLVRERSLWCSSCLIAYEGEEPVGFLYGCKRERETLLHRFAVHPEHLRRGHGRHLLTSISSKLAILGPPRLVVEAPEGAAAGLDLLRACDFRQEERLTDWRRSDAAPPADPSTPPGDPPGDDEAPGSLYIPVTAAELHANRLLEDGSPAPAWERAAPSLLALGDRLEGMALVQEERIVAAILYIAPSGGQDGRILHLRVTDGGEDRGSPDRLLTRLQQRQPGAWIFPRASEEEPAVASLRRHGFEPAARFLRLAATARSA